MYGIWRKVGEFIFKLKVKVLIPQSCLTLCDPMDFFVHGLLCPWTSLSMDFSRQESWNRLPFPSPGDLPDPGIKPGSPALQADFYLLSHQVSPDYSYLNFMHMQ